MFKHTQVKQMISWSKIRMILMVMMVVGGCMMGTSMAHSQEGTRETVAVNRPLLQLVAEPLQIRPVLGGAVDMIVEVYNHGDIAAEDVTVVVSGERAFAFSPQSVAEIAPGSSVRLTFPTVIDGYGIGQYPILISAAAVNLPVPVQIDAFITFQHSEIEDTGDFASGIVDSPGNFEVQQVQRIRVESDQGQIMRFTVSIDKDGAERHSPLRLDLSELLLIPDVESADLSVQYVDAGTADDGTVSFTYDAESKELLFTPATSGTYTINLNGPAGNSLVPTGPNDPASWTPSFLQPTVALFTGSASYSYPILVPPGPDGFQPDLTLNYNSATSYGALGKQQSGPVGWGWNLAGTIEVAQTVVLCDWNYGLVCPIEAYNDGKANFVRTELTLSIGGTGYNLVHNLGAGQTGYPGRYYVEGHAGLFAEFCHKPKLNSGSPSNLCLAMDDGDGTVDGAVTYQGSNGTAYRGFWVIKTPEDAAYRLGYTGDSLQQLKGMERGSGGRMGPWSDTLEDINPNAYPGPYTDALRWQVDEAQDRFGNTINYTYLESWPSEANGGWVDTHVHAPSSYLAQIDYGFNRIRFNLGTTSNYGSPPTDQPDSISWQTHRYNTIIIETQDYENPDGTYQTVRSYEFDYLIDKHGTYPGDDNDGLTHDTQIPQTEFCDKWPHNNLGNWKLGMLSSITELDRNGQDVLGNSGAATVPNAEFGYQFRKTGLIGFFNGTLPYRYCYPHLTEIFTLYGPPNNGSTPVPTVTFDYWSEDDEDFELPGGNEGRVNAVNNMYINGGWESDAPTQHIAYSYPADFDVDENNDDAFLGFREVQRTFYNNGWVHHHERTSFLTRNNGTWDETLNGRIAWQQLIAGDGTTILNQTTNTYSILTDYVSGSNPTKQPILQRTVSQDFINLTNNRQDFTYDVYGNQVTVQEFGDDLTGSTPIRTTESRFLRNTSAAGVQQSEYNAFSGGSFDTNPANWLLTDHAAAATVAGVPALRMWGDQGSSGVGWSHAPLRRASYNLSPGNGVSFRFRLADNHMGGRFSLRTEDGGGFIGLIFYGSIIYPDYNIWINNCTDPDGVCDIGFPAKGIPQVANVWYRGEMWIDAEGVGHWNVWREDNPTQRVSFALNDANAKAFFRGQNTRFHVHTGSTTSATSTIYLAGYEEITPNAWLVNLPWLNSTYEGLPSANIIVNRQRMRYDDYGCTNVGTAVPMNGLLTAVDAYIPGGGNSSCGTGWLTTDVSYGGAGGGSGDWWQPTRVEDPGDTWTQTNWLNHALVSSQETALGTTTFEYNDNIPWLLNRTIAANDSRTGYSYDTFGRLLRVTPPGPDRYQNSDYAVEYQYNDGQKPLYIDEIMAPGTPAEMITRTFYDGVGRPLQQRVQGMHSDVSVIVTDTNYNGLGRATCQTAPLTRSNLSFENLACTSVDHTITQYTQLGTATAIIGVDDVTTFSQTLGRTNVTLNGNKQIGIATADDLGRLIRVEEFSTTFDAFAGGNFNNSSGVWASLNPNKTAVIQENGIDILRVTGNGQWQDLAVRRQGGTLGADKGVMFRFRLLDGTMQGRLGIWSTTSNPATGNPGFLGVTLWNQTIYPEYNLGSGDIKRPGHQVPLRTNEWYRAYIGIDSDGVASWYLWSEALPGDLRQQYSWRVDSQLATDFFKDADFNFYIQPAIGRIDLAEMQEGNLFFTDYVYDLQDNLEMVTDAFGNETIIEYDELGRKVSMDDPDMGFWSYGYDFSSNLVRQTDELDNRLCFYYDDLNRLTAKYHSGTGEAACPAAGSGELLAAYTYYTSGPGLGMLNTVSGGTASGGYSDTFTYDYRGRVTNQTRIINGRAYLMASTYDNLDRPIAVTYPDGETVTTSYDGQMPNTLTAGSTPLIANMIYNQRGQLTFMDRATVPNTTPDTTYTYANAAGNYRLEQLDHGTLSDYRPDLTYSYDTIGNIVGLTTETLDGTDVQTFSYDSLNRLITSAATGGIADYTYNYTYNAIGNITQREGTGGTYTYGYSSKPHAIQRINGAPHFYYDANGNMINRIEDDRGYVQLFDVENRMIAVVSGAAAIGYDLPMGYSAPNSEEAVVNNGMTSGFMDASRKHNYTFTFAPGVTVNNFSLHMLDYGDFNPHLATVHTASLTAYSANGTILDTHTISYETLALNNPRSGTWISPNPGTAVGDLYYVGDAIDAVPGEPGNYTFTVNGNNISRVELTFSNNVTGIGSSDPNIGFTDLCFTSQAVGGQVCPDFSQVEAGTSIEGLGAVNPNLNISTGTGGGETTRFAYDANGQRILTLEPDGTQIYYPYAGYEEEITPGSGSQLAALPNGGDVTAVVLPRPALQSSPDGIQSTNELSLFAIIAIGSLLFLISVGTGQIMNAPKHRAKLRLTWQRHRVMVGKAISLASLVGLLVNTVFLNPISQAAPAAAPPLGPIQSPWTNTDIGSVGVTGSADETNGTFTLNGAGANIAGTVDAFHFVYQSLNGDGSITANTVSLNGGGTSPRAGLMMRDSLAADAIHVASVVQGNRIRVLDRASVGGSTTDVPGHSQGAPEWLRIERSGNTFTLSRSNDGVNWFVMQTRTINMGAIIYVGMVVTGNSTTTLATGTFNNVSVSGDNSPTCSYGPYDLSQNSRVEAEDFRCGGEGVAFHEELTADTGPGSGDYRTDVSTQGPDLELTDDVGDGYNLGWTRSGEWLEYEVVAPQAGDYDLTLRYAADPAWPFDVRLTTSQNSTQLGDSGVMSLSSTGGYQIWGDHVVTLPLAAGTNIVRLANEGGRGNVNYIDIVPASPPPPPPQQEMIIQRKTYSIGGQAIANRVVTFIESVETDNQVYYIHSDHLGSVSVLTKMSDGYVVNDSKAYYTPFGDFRLQPTSDLTDMGYTGHLGNNTGSNDISLIYMNARYYVPSVGRFASADTIIPNPANPQQFNRYSYVLNSPLLLTDPTGHSSLKEELLEGGDAQEGGSDYGAHFESVEETASNLLPYAQTMIHDGNSVGRYFKSYLQDVITNENTKNDAQKLVNNFYSDFEILDAGYERHYDWLVQQYDEGPLTSQAREWGREFCEATCWLEDPVVTHSVEFVVYELADEVEGRMRRISFPMHSAVHAFDEATLYLIYGALGSSMLNKVERSQSQVDYSASVLQIEAAQHALYR